MVAHPPAPSCWGLRPQTPVSSPDERLDARVGATMAHLMEEVRAVLEDQRPGAAYWVDHYVVPAADVDRWNRFYTNVLGAVARPEDRPRRPERRGGLAFTDLGKCHVGASRSKEPLVPASVGPRY